MANFDTMANIRKNKKRPSAKRKLNIKAIVIAVVLVVILTIGAVLIINKINSEKCQISMYAEINGFKMEDEGTYAVRPGDTITVEASSTDALIYCIGYYWNNGEITDVYDNRITIVVPENAPGSKEVLFVEALGANDDGSKNTKTKTGWYKYTLIYAE